jgi:hypothetical protein
MNVRCSKPATGMVPSGTTLIRTISAPQAIQRIDYPFTCALISAIFYGFG